MTEDEEVRQIERLVAAGLATDEDRHRLAYLTWGSLSEDDLGKMDGDLARMLRNGGPDDPVVAIARLRLGEPDDPEPRASDFGSRTEYRTALIERRKRLIRRDAAATLHAIRAMGLLDDDGGYEQTVGFLCLRGPAWRVREAVRLPGIANAYADRKMDLIQ